MKRRFRVSGDVADHGSYPNKKARTEQAGDPPVHAFSVLPPDCWRSIASRLCMRDWAALKLTCNESVEVFRDWHVVIPPGLRDVFIMALGRQLDDPVSRVIKRAVQSFMKQDLQMVNRITTAVCNWANMPLLTVLPDVSQVAVSDTGSYRVPDFYPLFGYPVHLVYNADLDQWDFTTDGEWQFGPIHPDYANWFATEVLVRYKRGELDGRRTTVASLLEGVVGTEMRNWCPPADHPFSATRRDILAVHALCEATHDERRRLELDIVDIKHERNIRVDELAKSMHADIDTLLMDTIDQHAAKYADMLARRLVILELDQKLISLNDSKLSMEGSEHEKEKKRLEWQLLNIWEAEQSRQARWRSDLRLRVEHDKVYAMLAMLGLQDYYYSIVFEHGLETAHLLARARAPMLRELPDDCGAVIKRARDLWQTIM